MGEVDLLTIGCDCRSRPQRVLESEALICALGLPNDTFHVVRTRLASGVLLATVAFSMIREAVRLASLSIAVGGSSTGFLTMYAFDLSFIAVNSPARKRKGARSPSDSIRKASRAAAR